MEAVNAKKPFVAFPINSCSIILPSQPREQLHNYQGTKNPLICSCWPPGLSPFHFVILLFVLLSHVCYLAI